MPAITLHSLLCARNRRCLTCHAWWLIRPKNTYCLKLCKTQLSLANTHWQQTFVNYNQGKTIVPYNAPFQLVDNRLMRILKLTSISMSVNILFLKDSALVTATLNHSESASSLVLSFPTAVITSCKDSPDFIHSLKYNCREINECEIRFHK